MLYHTLHLVFIKSICGTITLLFLLIGSPVPLRSQELRLNHIGQSEGLSNLLNVHFKVDQEGFFFTSSRDGLNRFDGQHIKVFRPLGDSISPESNISSEVFLDNDLNRWFTTNNAIHCLVSGTDSIYSRSFSSATSSYHYAFHLEKGRVLWFVANKFLYRLEVNKPKAEPEPIAPYDTYIAYWLPEKNDDSKTIIRPLLDGQGGIEITTLQNSRVEKIDSFFNSRNKFGQPSLDIAFLNIDSSNLMWLPTNEGLVCFNPQKPEDWKLYKHRDNLPKYGYEDAASLNDQYLLIVGIESGILAFDKINRKFVRQDSLFWINEELIKMNQFNRIQVDRYRNLWLSSFGKGVYYSHLDNTKFQFLSTEPVANKMEEFNIRSIVEKTDQTLLFNSKQGTVFSHHPDKTVSIQNRSNITNQFGGVKSLYIDSKGRIWAATNNVILVFTKNMSSNELEEVIDLKKTEGILEVEEDTYLTYNSQRIHILKRDTINNGFDIDHFDVEIHLPSKLFFDSKNNILFLAQSNNSLRLFELNNSFNELKSITNIGIVRGFSPSNYSQVLWLATSTGLFFFDPLTRKVHKILDAEKKLDRAFTGVVEDSVGNVWLSSYYGIYRYLPNTQEVDFFTQSDGLRTMQYVENSSLYATNGMIYFGGNKGVTIIDPCQVTKNTNLPKINLVNCKVNEKDINYSIFNNSTSSVKLDHNQNTLLFDFSIIEYGDPSLNQMKYFVIKDLYDTIRVDYENPIRLNLLPHGHYRLDIYASNSDNVWTPAPKSYFFTILPPWYITWWAITLYILLSGYLLYRWYRYRIQQVEKKEAEKRREAEYKQKEAEFRQKEAEYKQLVAETETAILRLQMNPHFLFNSMNSINSYILQKDIDTASYYLTHFAKLMRQILELSKHPFIEIYEEIAFLEQYLQAEGMRMGKKLEYEFEVDQQIDQDETLIPTMLLQPFVENAIWHGVSELPAGGLVNVRFLLRGKRLLCEVEDNGVGRKEKSTLRKEHQSKALVITKRRLQLLTEEHAEAAHFEIIDLKNQNGEASGTKVQIFLPIL